MSQKWAPRVGSVIVLVKSIQESYWAKISQVPNRFCMETWKWLEIALNPDIFIFGRGRGVPVSPVLEKLFTGRT